MDPSRFRQVRELFDELADRSPAEAEERLAAVARDQNILLMGCDQCCYEREIKNKLVDGAVIGCFPNLYEGLASNMPDHVITL